MICPYRLCDQRLSQVSHRRTPVDEVMKRVDCYQTHQDRRVKERAVVGITDREQANESLCRPSMRHSVIRPAKPGVFPCRDPTVLNDLLCAHHERTVGSDNGVRYRRRVLPIPADQHRCHDVKARVKGLAL